MIPELVATVATFAVTTLWLGPCDIVYLWSILNCFGLNFELWVQKLAEWGPLARIEVSREDLGLGWLGPWRGWHCCSREASSHTWPSVLNILTTTLLVVRTVAHPVDMWPSRPSVGCGTPRLSCVSQALPSLQTCFPIFNNERES